MFLRLAIGFLLLFAGVTNASASKLFIPMDSSQSNHLKAYGIVYNAIKAGARADWLLNYQGGSFALEYTHALYAVCTRSHVSVAQMSDITYADIVARVKAKGSSGDVVVLDKVPRMAVYTPSGKKPWDDAVTLALTYAEISFDKVYVDEVLSGALNKYDWLHLHHEDFTGQLGKFWKSFHDADWYINDRDATMQLTARHGYQKISQMQLAVVKKIRDFVSKGGNLFAMCSATDTYDIALAANGTDICDTVFDGDGIDPNAQAQLDFSRCFAFRNFTLITTPEIYEYSSIDNTMSRLNLMEHEDNFTLSQYAATTDPVPAMLCQNHTMFIKGFMGQTTAFRKDVLKPGLIIMAENKKLNEVRYLHGRYKDGSFTFYGGHDPEDYQHNVSEPPTALEEHPNSPGYRLILNNVLCMASGKKAVTASNTYIPAIEKEIAPAAPAPYRIAPGSSENTLTISALAGSRIQHIAFITNAGNVIFAQEYNVTNVTVDISSFPAGMYNIKVNGAYAGKIAKN